MENRRKPAPPAATLDINCDCKEYMLDYLKSAFPTRLMASSPTPMAEPRSEPMMVDEDGYPVSIVRSRSRRATT
jgi:hypothetical protein